MIPIFLIHIIIPMALQNKNRVFYVGLSSLLYKNADCTFTMYAF
jgi:hypothetical protein